MLDQWRNSWRRLGWAHHSIETRRFPDTEGYIRIPDEMIDSIREEQVVLVSNTFPDSGIIETLLMLEAINDVRKGNMANLKKLARKNLKMLVWHTTSNTILCYSRQDKRFRPGEAVSARAIANLLASRCDGIIVFDLHAPKVLEGLSVPVAFTSAMPELAKHLQESVESRLYSLSR